MSNRNTSCRGRRSPSRAKRKRPNLRLVIDNSFPGDPPLTGLDGRALAAAYRLRMLLGELYALPAYGVGSVMEEARDRMDEVISLLVTDLGSQQLREAGRKRPGEMH
jgi:hypothetical protein